MAKAKGRAKQFQDLDEPIAKDYDPEANVEVSENGSGSEESEDENAGTEHYVSVGKTRDEAEANDSEIESDDALGESDEERFKEFTFRGSSNPKKPVSKRATAADYMSSSDDGGAGIGEDEDDESESVEDDMDDGLHALVDEAKAKNAKPIMAALSTRPDVDKGLAIRQQRKAYDGLLNIRIRLQKALIAANTLDALDANPEPESEPYEAAEEAAIKLLNTISSLKDNFGPSRAGEKRKRELDVSMATSEIWEQLQAEEQRSIKSREDRLEKWSRKVQSVNVTAPKGLESRNKTLVSALKEQLIDPDNRLAKRSRVPRSCAPAQAAKGASENSNIYDDADFYQVLLKELVDQRTVEGSSGAGAGAAVPTVVLTAAKDVKSRKNVDRKASKGRKMRFTVHEKLQNFMAPEDRRAWEQGAIDRFFGTLFGRKMELNEDESEDDMDVDVEEAGLRLFRN
ncbi:hypothetical protein AU210_009472 [Fusarium oxysporum f. sp. radicis-cucumerinum]|uniref:Protein BFR2 n=1 Tax=Fusarium oxysporum f. sp. radicis-cucumerinum TaxID=327505 RepID=A0A2H3GTW7_FUSOX|nr:hypothetical protein AU210_009472 [Fusarium oxysporum f. sp. radicis-cucumerinum]